LWPQKDNMQRVLILVLTYNAARHIESVLERIPKDLPGWQVDVLVLDDASTDATYRIVSDHAARNASRPILTGRNAFNQGYGGNQKIGYRYAIDQGYDAVVLLHGDGQYPPESI